MRAMFKVLSKELLDLMRDTFSRWKYSEDFEKYSKMLWKENNKTLKSGGGKLTLEMAGVSNSKEPSSGKEIPPLTVVREDL